MNRRYEPAEALFGFSAVRFVGTSAGARTREQIQAWKIAAAGNLGYTALGASVISRDVPLAVADTGILTVWQEGFVGALFLLYASSHLDRAGQRLAGSALAQGWEPVHLRKAGNKLEALAGRVDAVFGRASASVRRVETKVRHQTNDYWAEQRAQFRRTARYAGDVALSGWFAYEATSTASPQEIRLATGFVAAIAASLAILHDEATCPLTPTEQNYIAGGGNPQLSSDGNGPNAEFMLD